MDLGKTEEKDLIRIGTSDWICNLLLTFVIYDLIHVVICCCLVLQLSSSKYGGTTTANKPGFLQIMCQVHCVELEGQLILNSGHGWNLFGQAHWHYQICFFDFWQPSIWFYGACKDTYPNTFKEATIVHDFSRLSPQTAKDTNNHKSKCVLMV